MDDLDIRHYQTSDQAAVLSVAADTAFFGEPVEAFLDDRKLYGDAFASYYIEHESPFAWVADGQDGVIGFLLGCADTTRQVSQWRSYIINRVLVRALTGRYKLGKRTAGFAWGMLAGVLRGEGATTNVKEYPAHLQIDVKQGYRGLGVGRGLIEAYLEQLRGLAVPGVHLETTDHNEAACHLYEKVGFTLLDERPNHFWTRMFGFQVNDRSYGLKLR